MKTVYIIIGYEERNDQGQLKDSCQIEVFASSENEAIKKAKGYINKSFYKVTGVIEK